MAKVCIVDDCNFIIEVYTDFLSKMGHSVTSFNSPFGATARIANLKPDVLLMDLNLPGLSGEALLQLLQGSSAAAPVIVISADQQEASMQRVVASGLAKDYFLKSQKLELLELKIRKIAGAV